MEEKNNKSFFSKLFSKKTKKSSCCNIQFEEVLDDNENTNEVDKEPDITSKDKKSMNSKDCCCG